MYPQSTSQNPEHNRNRAEQSYELIKWVTRFRRFIPEHKIIMFMSYHRIEMRGHELLMRRVIIRFVDGHKKFSTMRNVSQRFRSPLCFQFAMNFCATGERWGDNDRIPSFFITYFPLICGIFHLLFKNNNNFMIDI